MGCWLLALGLLVGLAAAIYYLSRMGAVLVVQRDRQRHLAIVNAARQRAGKPPLTLDELPPEPPPERDPLLEKLLGIDSAPGRGFAVLRSRADEQVVRETTLTGDREALPVLPVATGEHGAEAGGRPGPTEPVGAMVVLLERRPRALERGRLVAAVERAWNVEIPDEPAASATGDDHVVMTRGASGEEVATVACGGYRFVVENHLTSYFADPEPLAAQVGEMRAQQAVLQCGAWRSIAVVGETPELDEEGAYALLLKLAAELAGAGTLGVYLPRLERFFPYDETVLRAMLSERPLRELLEAKIAWAPVVSETDAELASAMAEARRRLGEFREAFAARSVTGGGKRSPFLVKARFTEGDACEHMWVEVTSIEDDRFTGVLRSAPVVLTGLTEGEQVTVREADISDWIATVGPWRRGDFTGEVLRRRGLVRGQDG